MTKSHSVSLGPPIPIVPRKDFSRIPLTREHAYMIWSIIGPSVEVNMQRDIPLWKIIVAAYCEGLDHGASIARNETL